MSKRREYNARIGSFRALYMLRRGQIKMAAVIKNDPVTKIREMERESREYDKANYLLGAGKISRQDFDKKIKGYQDNLFDFSDLIARQTT